MDRILELLGRLTELTAEELTELDGLITAEAERVAAEPRSAENVELLGTLADGMESVRTENTRRADEQAALDEQAEAALARLRPVEDPADGAEGEPAGDQTAEGEPAGDEPAEAPQAVAASARTAARRPNLAAIGQRRPAGNDPAARQEATGTPQRASLVAAADVPGHSAGQEFESMRALAEAFERRRSGVGKGGKGSDGERVIVASARFDFPEDRILGKDAETNERRINAVAAPEAIVAAGGLCAPLENIYDVEVVGSTARPVRDSLAQFQADRGGVSLRPSPVFQDMDGAVEIWTQAIDAAPGGATKNILEVICSAFEDFTVDAIPVRLRFHNIASRFDPEGTAANIRASMIAHARIAENELLAKMAAQCLTLTSPRVLGASRDLLVNADKVIAYHRNRQRLDDSMRLRTWLPRWVRDMIRADLTRGDLSLEAMALADQQINDFFDRRNVNVTWHLDGRTAAVAGPPAVAAQSYAAAANNGVLPEFPDIVEQIVAAEGDFLFLDGGELDLGIVRDSTLNGVNEYQSFVETFEGLAARGVEPLRVLSTTDPNGLSAGSIDTSAISD